MDAGELITYCSLAGDVKTNKQLTDGDGELTDFYMMEMFFQGQRVMFQYHKDGDKLTFIHGTAMISDPKLGTGLTTIHGFKHLMKTLNISCNS